MPGNRRDPLSGVVLGLYVVMSALVFHAQTESLHMSDDVTSHENDAFTASFLCLTSLKRRDGADGSVSKPEDGDNESTQTMCPPPD